MGITFYGKKGFLHMIFFCGIISLTFVKCCCVGTFNENYQVRFFAFDGLGSGGGRRHCAVFDVLLMPFDDKRVM